MIVHSLGLTELEKSLLEQAPEIDGLTYREAFTKIHDFINDDKYNDLFIGCVIDLAGNVILIQRAKQRKLYI